MKVKQILVFILISVSLIATGCTNNEVEGNEVENNNTYSEIRDVVLNYIEEQDWNPEPYSRSNWENATVKKITVDDSYKNINKSYIGKEIFTVTIEDAIAAPTVFVDPDTLEVIGIMPGE
ncbi:hypothetical protein [Psychrobacillus vulpis]|uniref:Uncharacterized protein n=1 Tax=Psychrobacillus vulpis TaxID=2325572 RepID=A0A544TPS2_9BACI|nr:hypothetical protein [Psychrobacillus vulpis]TQR19451.1 hypothetical protein FG384_12440 [Psychrobacillus vulpis]